LSAPGFSQLEPNFGKVYVRGAPDALRHMDDEDECGRRSDTDCFGESRTPSRRWLGFRCRFWL